MDIKKIRTRLNGAVRRAARRRLPATQYERYARFLWRWVSALGGHQLETIGVEKALADSLSMFRYFDGTGVKKINIDVRSPQEEEITYVDIVLQNVPFAVASILNFFASENFFIHTQYNFILFPQDSAHKQDEGLDFVVMRFELQALSSEEAIVCKNGINSVLTGIRTSNEDWQTIKQRLSSAIADYSAKSLPESEVDRRKLDFLSWLVEDKCLFLGYTRKDSQTKSSTSALGLLRPRIITPALQKASADLPVRAGIRFAKLPVRSLIHRPIYIEAITLGIPQGNGDVVEHRFILLYAYDLYNYALENIPHLRETFNGLLNHFHLIRNSYRGRILRYSVASYPRNELLKIAGDERLPNLIEPVMEAFSYSTLRCAYYYDDDRLFAQTLILMPRDDYDSDLRQNFARLLREIFDSDDCDFDVLFSETQLVRIFFTLPLKKDAKIDEDRLDNLQTELEKIGTSWKRQLRLAFVEEFGKKRGIKMFREQASIFPAGYTGNHSVSQASADILKILSVGEGEKLLDVELRISENKLRLFDRREGHSLSQIVHILENLGIEPIASRPYLFETNFQHPVRLTEFQLRHFPDRGSFLPSASELNRLFAKHFTFIYGGAVDSDAFNNLTLSAGLSWDEVQLFRCLTAYLAQVQNQYDRSYLENAFCSHPYGLFLLKEMFVQKFEPRINPQPAVYRKLVHKFTEYVDAIPSAEEDQIFRYLRELISNIQRTNFYARNPTANFVLSLKFSPNRLSYVTSWNPEREIFVYAVGFEGTHMRDGALSRGGIRWSQRRAGYRNEVLNLVLAQVLKNSIIVPTGGKGGFYIKDPKLSAEDTYRDFIDALLHLTDNYEKGKIKHPPGMRIYDAEDPYLVVAPDKGTATFSDFANEVAHQRNYWLGDAFASGGSEGYNHKTMGITAKGAWVSVCRHFAELGIDAEKDPIEVIGIGDMSGDVFGNGMLLSKSIHLIFAFNHKNIFIDPNPDPIRSYQERKRLFGLPASSWRDYDPKCISEGGGVFGRDEKFIVLSKQIAKRLHIREKKIRPDALIKHILVAQADLLWFGGIGTYVKGSVESNRDIGDKANSALRVDGRELRARVIGEGANLGVTQAGRIEFATSGGRVATDAHDNSGGVHCSDKEVNIKIFVSQLKAFTAAKRSKFLQSMTEEISASVLKENYAQSLCLSLENDQAQRLWPAHKALMLRFGEEMAAGDGPLTRPELSDLISRCKRYLRQHLENQATLKEPLIAASLEAYYPSALGKQLASHIKTIPFIKQVADVHAVNMLVDGLGLAFWADEEDGLLKQLPAFTAHFLQLESLFGFARLSHELAASAEHYPALLPRLLSLRQTHCELMRYCMRYAPSYQTMRGHLPVLAELLVEQQKKQRTGILPEAFGSEQRKRYLIAESSQELLFVSRLSQNSAKSIHIFWKLYQHLDAELGIRLYARSIRSMYRPSDWERSVLRALVDEFYEQAGRILSSLLRKNIKDMEPDEIFKQWRDENASLLNRYKSVTGHHEKQIDEEEKMLLMQYLIILLKKMSVSTPA